MTIDWPNSYILFSPKNMGSTANTARANIIGVAETDGDFVYLGSTCAGELTYEQKRFMIDERKFTFNPMFGSENWRFIRNPPSERKANRGSYDRLEVSYLIKERPFRPINDPVDVARAADSGKSFSAEIIADNWRIRFPVPTINTLASVWQIDAGPTIVPGPFGATDLDSLRIGFVVASSLRPHIHIMSEEISHWGAAKRELYTSPGKLVLYVSD